MDFNAAYMNNDFIYFAVVFLQGLLSFSSPCVLPLLPVYISYLAGGTKKDKQGITYFNKKKVIINTIFFTLGISVVFFILGLAFTGIGKLTYDYRRYLNIAGGILVILFGLYSLDIFKFSILNREKKLELPLEKMASNPITAFLLGLSFSFSWTPCIGPILSSVLLMASASHNTTKGILLIIAYILGFIVPFILTGFFTTTLLNFFKKHNKIVKYTVKLAGIIMIVVGIFMLFNKSIDSIFNFNSDNEAVTSVTSQRNKESSDKITDSNNTASNDTENKSTENNETKNDTSKDSQDTNTEKETSNNKDADKTYPPDIELTDQNGVKHKLSDYRGKVVLLNFWATWCPPCRHELPFIEEVYKEYNENKDDVVILGIVAPGMGNEGSIESIKKFLDDNKITYPILMDEGGNYFSEYGIFSFPTTFMINKDGYVFGYVNGGMSKSVIKDIIKQTIENKKQTQ